MLMESFVPNSFTRALVMTLGLLVRKTEDGTKGAYILKKGSFAICCIDIIPV
jgi:hypothetical protein